MEDKSKGMAIAGLLVAVGLVLLGLCIKSAIDGFKDKELNKTGCMSILVAVVGLLVLVSMCSH